MKALISVICLSVLWIGCTKKNPATVEESNLNNGIYHGQYVSPEGKSWKTTISIMSLKNVDDADGKFCTGTIISNKTILTAAHCVEGLIAKLFVVTYEGSKIANLAPYLPESFTVISYPQYNVSDSAENDFALISFQQEIISGEHSPALIANPDSIVEGENAVFVGSGRNEDGHFENPNILRFTNIMLESINGNSDEEREGIIKLDNPDTGICHGDSGGPIYRRNSENQFELLGIESRGFSDDPTCRADPREKIALISRPVYNWIGENIFQQEIAKCDQPTAVEVPDWGSYLGFTLSSQKTTELRRCQLHSSPFKYLTWQHIEGFSLSYDESEGVELSFNGNQELVAIHLKKWWRNSNLNMGYKGKLPYGILFSDSQNLIREKLGTPDKSGGGPSTSYQNFWDKYSLNEYTLRIEYGEPNQPSSTQKIQLISITKN